jgi:hypothetical protein
MGITSMVMRKIVSLEEQFSMLEHTFPKNRVINSLEMTAEYPHIHDCFSLRDM